EGIGALLGVDRNTVFPGGAAAKDAVELDAGFAGELKSLGELGIAHTGGKIDERLGRYAGGLVEELDGFFLGVSLLSGKRLGAFDKLHVHRDLYFQHIDSIAIFA